MLIEVTVIRLTEVPVALFTEGLMIGTSVDSFRGVFEYKSKTRNTVTESYTDGKCVGAGEGLGVVKMHFVCPVVY